MDIRVIDLETHGDERGTLISLEELKNVPFEIKRVYYMYDTRPGVRRGYHAHKCLKQILICVSGECKILLDDGTDREVVHLNQPNQGLIIESYMWREMFDFSENAVLMVAASEYYDEADYIRNYQEFIEYVKNRG